jgi:transposase
VKDITTTGVDLAKKVTQVHGVDRQGKGVLKKRLPCRRFAEFFANLPPCLFGMQRSRWPG